MIAGAVDDEPRQLLSCADPATRPGFPWLGAAATILGGDELVVVRDPLVDEPADARDGRGCHTGGVRVSRLRDPRARVRGCRDAAEQSAVGFAIVGLLLSAFNLLTWFAMLAG